MSDLEAMVARARAALDGRPPQAKEVEEPGPFLGAAADGQVTAEVAADGTVRSLAIEPKLFTEPLDDLATAARDAINAALDARPNRTDFAPVIDLVRAAQQQARRDMSAITAGMAEVAQHVRTTRGGA